MLFSCNRCVAKHPYCPCLKYYQYGVRVLYLNNKGFVISTKSFMKNNLAESVVNPAGFPGYHQRLHNSGVSHILKLL